MVSAVVTAVVMAVFIAVASLWLWQCLCLSLYMRRTKSEQKANPYSSYAFLVDIWDTSWYALNRPANRHTLLVALPALTPSAGQQETVSKAAEHERSTDHNSMKRLDHNTINALSDEYLPHLDRANTNKTKRINSLAATPAHGTARGGLSSFATPTNLSTKAWTVCGSCFEVGGNPYCEGCGPAASSKVAN